jgi:D-alanyl-lipoteichoic acid acyltransferase DltB (MBOAT superfamily)
MDNASFQFVGFGLAVALISNFSRSPVWRSAVLLVASLIFIGLVERNPLALLPMAGFLLLGYGCLLLIERGWSRSLAWVLVAVIFVYIWLKKYTFLPEGSFLHYSYFVLGLSYIFFRVLHLLIEAADRTERRHIGIGAYLTYTINFTTLVSGPIQRYDKFAQDQFAVEPIPLGPRVMGSQLERIIRGFFKVNVLAMLFNMVRVDAFAQLSQPLPVSFKLYAAFRLAVVFPLFLYCNFSGYIDIVIALARLMRIRLPENFDRPFAAPSFIDFWNRWHITLSTWLKTYVYNPLLVVLMRRISSPALQPLLGTLALFVAFFLIGLWHGRTSEFIFFGILQGGGVALNKLWQMGLAGTLGTKRYRGLAKNPLYIAFSRGLTFSWFAFTLFWFWSDWGQIDSDYHSIGRLNWSAVWLAVWLSSTVVLALWEWLRAVLLSIRTSEGPILVSRYALVVYASALGLISLVVTVLLNQPAPGIVYKAF